MKRRRRAFVASPPRACAGYARVAPLAATLAAACALALVIAYWGWELFGPSPVHVVAPPPADPAAAIVAAHVFGRVDGASRDAGPAAANLPGDTRLLGIIASANERGYALFRLPSGPRVVAEGQDVTNGVRLVAIAPDAITLRDASGERRFALRSNAASNASKSLVASTRMIDASSDGPRVALASKSCAPPSGFQGNVVRLNTELLGGLTGDAGPWRTLLASSDSGLIVRDGNGFGAMLGLQAGDRIAQANGIALRVPDDVASAVIRPLVANQGVRIVGSRAGTRQELWLANIACAG
jgi:hypothetical protein